MHKTLIRFAAVALACSLPLAAQNAPRELLTAQDVITMPRVGDPQVSPDGRLIAYTVAEPSLETNKAPRQVWIASHGSETPPRRVREGASPRWSPDGRLIAFIAAAGDAPQVWLMSADGTNARAITTLSTGAADPVWSPDGSKIAFVSEVWPDLPDDAAQKARADEIAKSGVKALVFEDLLFRHWNTYLQGKLPQLFIVDVATGATTQLTKERRAVPPFTLGGPPDFAFSADSSKVYFTRGATRDVAAWTTNADLCVIPASGGDVVNLTGGNTGWDGSPAPSSDGRFVAYRSQERDGYESDLFRLMLLDAKTGTSRRVASELRDSVGEMVWGPGNDTLYVSVESSGSHDWYAVKTDSGAATRVFDGKAGNTFAASASADRKTFACMTASLVSAPEIAAFDPAGGASSVRPLTTLTQATLAARAMPSRESFTWEGARDTMIQGWLLKPPGFDATKRYPMVVFIHGGPQGAWMDAWSTRWNPAIYASAGYVVFAPNPHGSTGFGQAFCEQISGDWGGAVFEDIQKGVDAVVALGYVDADRIGAAGGSYGGYMVNWILGHDDRYKALVSHCGVYNLESMYGATEELWFPEWEFRGTPWDNPELFQKWSPHRAAAAFKTPTLVIHGELDYRVPVTQGFELFTTLRRRGVPAKFLYYPDEGHWVLKPKNSLLWNQTVMAWFDRYLKG